VSIKYFIAHSKQIPVDKDKNEIGDDHLSDFSRFKKGFSEGAYALHPDAYDGDGHVGMY